MTPVVRREIRGYHWSEPHARWEADTPLLNAIARTCEAPDCPKKPTARAVIVREGVRDFVDICDEHLDLLRVVARDSGTPFFDGDEGGPTQ